MTGSRLADRLAREIIDMILMGKIDANEHLSTPKLADLFGVSRSPVREALLRLEKQGILLLQQNRGFFVRQPIPEMPKVVERNKAAGKLDAYHSVAEDWLKDSIPAEVTEQYLRKRYGLTQSELAALLNRAIDEGWMERKQGYGWRFLPVAKTPEALTQIYRFRSIIEPAAFMEDTFQLDRNTLKELKGIQESLLRSEIVNLPADRLATINSQFHEELIRMSGNLFMHQALVRLNRTRRLLEYRSMIDRSRIYKQCEEHLAIIELLARGANLEASYFMRTHLIGALAGKLASSDIVADDTPDGPGPVPD